MSWHTLAGLHAFGQVREVALALPPVSRRTRPGTRLAHSPNHRARVRVPPPALWLGFASICCVVLFSSLRPPDRSRRALLFARRCAGAVLWRGARYGSGVRSSLLLAILLAASACAGLTEDMRRTETAFSEARYEDVLVWLAELEPSLPDMSRRQRTLYYYVAGVTASRLDDRARARHYLTLCREEAGVEGFALSEERQRNLKLTLRELTGE